MHHAAHSYSEEATDLRPWWRQLNGYQWWVLIVATLGWLFDNMDQRLFVLARTPALRDLMPGASEGQLAEYGGYATAIFIVGWATGGLIFGLFGDRWGRTRTMMITILIYALFTGLSAFSQRWWDFALYRVLSGIGVGGEFAAGAALVAEVMPSRARPYALGSLMAVSGLGNMSGSALSLVFGPQASIGPVAGWRVLFLFGIVPALLVVVIRLRLREPERWLQARQKAEESAKGFRPAIGAGPLDGTHQQLGDLREIFGDRRWRYHTLIGMTLGIVGQIGVWGVGFWTPELYRGVLLQQRRIAIQAQQGDDPERAAVHKELNLGGLAAASTQEGAEELARRWKAEDDRLVGRGTLLQDVGSFFGVYAFTLVTAWLGRRGTFALASGVALAGVLVVFGCLDQTSDIYWMAPLLGFGYATMFGGYAIYFPELYPTRLRSTGTGFCYNVARYITALGPLTLGKLALLFGNLGYAMPLRPAAMSVATIYLAGMIAAYFAPETKDQPLPT